MLTINSHSVEISIARFVEEMVRETQIPRLLLFFLLFFYLYNLRFVSSSRYKNCMQR